MLVGLDWVSTHGAIFFTHHMFMHIFMHTYFSFLSLNSVVIVFCLSSLFLSSNRLRMVPKRKSTSTQNPLRDFGSFGSFDPLPHFSIWFCGEKAHKDFLENFQQRGVHSEC